MIGHNFFISTKNDTKSSLLIYSIMETEKDSGLKSFKYFEYLFRHPQNIDTSNKGELEQVFLLNQQ